MRILFVADGRSPIALNWMRYFIAAGHEVHLASSFPCQAEAGLASFTIIPVALSEVKASGSSAPSGSSRERLLRKVLPVGLRTGLRQWLGPLTLPRAARQLRGLIAEIQPELVHAMRIPYEGMVAALAMQDGSLPLLISVWGNDFTLHAPSTPLMRRYTRLALRRADALHSDCQRDQRLAAEWGFDPAQPALVAPGAGGIQLEVFYPDPAQQDEPPLVLNPRGLRAYVRSDTIFKAFQRVHAQRPEVRFACSGMAGESEAQRWVDELNLSGAVELLAPLKRDEMAALFRSAQVMLSITTHDGTPNTLLEGMASGCFPIAGELESIREWITPGVNGLLVDAGDAEALAEAILQALDDNDLRAGARDYNLDLVRERAESGGVMRQVENFYMNMIKELTAETQRGVEKF